MFGHSKQHSTAQHYRYTAQHSLAQKAHSTHSTHSSSMQPRVFCSIQQFGLLLARLSERDSCQNCFYRFWLRLLQAQAHMTRRPKPKHASWAMDILGAVQRGGGRAEAVRE
eukprot:COSAG01_NODE_986_length_12320_cov_19.750818_5_plen_111_part_00